MIPVDIAFLPEVVGRLVTMMAPLTAEEVNPGDRLISDLGFQSLALVELAFTMEELFELEEMVADQAIGIETVADIIEFLRAQFAAGAARFPDETQLVALAAQYDYDWKPLA